jgi:hypothetical protein
MPFGLTNAPARFQTLMNTILKDLTWHQCMVYLDDVVAFLKTFEDHVKRLKKVLARIEEADLKLKPSKCTFGVDNVVYLGFHITRDGIKPDENKTKVIEQMEPPKNVSEVRRFLGMASFYRRNIPYFSEIASPLYKLTNLKHKFDWSQECQAVFDIIKRKLVEAPVLAYPDFSEKFHSTCTATHRTMPSERFCAKMWRVKKNQLLTQVNT